MKHILFFYHLIAFLLGISTITLTLVAYYKYKKNIIITFTISLIGMSLIVMEQSLTTYQIVNEIDMGGFYIFLKIISWLSSTILLYFIPKLVYQIFEVGKWERRRVIFIITGSISLILMILHYISRNKLFLNLSSVLLFGSILFAIIIVIKKHKNIKKNLNKSILRSYSILSVLLLPFMFLDTKTEQLANRVAFLEYGLLTLPTFYLIFNGLTIYWVIHIMLKKPHYFIHVINQEERVHRICNKYRITEREKDVIKILINGLSYNDIADELNISLSTVKTHVRNVYRKLSISNKFELINLINQEN